MEEPGVPLGHYLDKEPGVRVALWCNACSAMETWEVADVVRRLDRQGIDGRAFGIRALAGRVRKRCKCGAKAWETRPDYPPVPGGGLSRG